MEEKFTSEELELIEYLANFAIIETGHSQESHKKEFCLISTLQLLEKVRKM